MNDKISSKEERNKSMIETALFVYAVVGVALGVFAPSFNWLRFNKNQLEERILLALAAPVTMPVMVWYSVVDNRNLVKAGM